MIGLVMRLLGVNKMGAWAISIVGLGAIGGGIVWWHGSQVEAVRAAGHDQGVKDERQSWQNVRAELLRRRQASISRRDNELATGRGEIRTETERQNDLLTALLAKRPAADRAAMCFDDDLVRTLEATRAAVRSAATAAGGSASVSILPGAAIAGHEGSDGKMDSPQ